MGSLRKIIFALMIILFLVGVLSISDANAYVSVKGYYRKDGTYVRPYVRSNPNGLKYDNYSWTPSQGLYNKSYSTGDSYWNTPTYLTDPSYYQGKSLYESQGNSLGSLGASFSIPSYQAYPTANAKSDTLYTPPKHNPSTKKYNVRYNKNITIYTQKFDLRDSIGGIIKSENGKTIYTVDKSGCLKSIKNLQVIKRMYGDSWSSYMSVVDDKVLKEYEFCGVVEE